MNTDPTMNVVIFQPRRGEPLLAHAPARHDDCVQQAWEMVRTEHRVRAFDVVRVHSEWQWSSEDAHFMRHTFSNLGESTYNVNRPGPDGWDDAFELARKAMLDAMSNVADVEAPPPDTTPMTKDEALRRVAEKAAAEQAARAGVQDEALTAGAGSALDTMAHVASEGELRPILRSDTTFALTEVIPHRELTPGLHIALATVALTPRGTIGMNHLTHHGLRQAGASFDDLLEAACDNLRDGLQIEGRGTDDTGVFLRLHRDGTPVSIVSAAVVLPDFHRHMSQQLEAEKLIAAIPCPDELYVAAADSPWAEMLSDMVHSSEYPDTELVPSLLSLDSSGITLISERQQRN
ncbi:MAG: hypothetical protein ACRDT8_02035 [Micromonosporaceae bacterium]